MNAALTRRQLIISSAAVAGAPVLGVAIRGQARTYAAGEPRAASLSVGSGL